MRRVSLVLLAPFLVSAADPVTVAQREADAAAREQQRLERSADAARSAAERAAAQAAAAAQAILAIDSRVALAEAQLLDLRRRKEALDRRLAEVRRPASALLAGLAQAGRQPAWLALAGAGRADEQVRLAALARTLGPEVERRAASLRSEAEALAAIQRRQQALQAGLVRDRQASIDAQQRFVAQEKSALATAATQSRQAFEATDQVLDRSERLRALASDAERRRLAIRLAASLAELPPSTPRPGGAEGEALRPPFAWQVPASGNVTVGLGELLDNGVRARGMTIAAAQGTQVIAPAPGRIAFAGPFRRRVGIVIIDHGKGWLTLLSEVRPGVRVGDSVAGGEPIGRALGPVTAELFRDGTAEPAALIARSSDALLSRRTTG